MGANGLIRPRLRTDLEAQSSDVLERYRPLIESRGLWASSTTVPLAPRMVRDIRRRGLGTRPIQTSVDLAIRRPMHLPAFKPGLSAPGPMS